MIVYRVTYGWVGQPERARYRDFGSRREAEAFADKWTAGGGLRTARVRPTRVTS